jgi:DnaJ-class molecular chaperone
MQKARSAKCSFSMALACHADGGAPGPAAAHQRLCDDCGGSGHWLAQPHPFRTVQCLGCNGTGTWPPASGDVFRWIGPNTKRPLPRGNATTGNP